MQIFKNACASLIATLTFPFVSYAQDWSNPVDPWSGQAFNNPNSYLGRGFSFGGGWGGGSYPGGVLGYGQTRPGRIGSFTDILVIAQRLLGYFQVIVFMTALFYLVWAGFLYARGNAKEAPGMILNAVIGILVALLAFTVIPLLCWLTQAGGQACGL